MTFADDIVKALLGGSGRGELGAIARAIGEETRQVLSALRFGIAVGAGGGREPEELTERQRLKAASCVRRLHHVIDTQFFDVLEARYRARGDERTAATVRNEYLQRLIAAARRLLDEVTTATAGSALYRRRAAAKSVDVFRQRLPRRANVLAGDPDVAGRGTAPRDEDDAGDEGVVVVDGVRLDVRGLSRELASLERRQVTALSRGPLAR